MTVEEMVRRIGRGRHAIAATASLHEAAGMMLDHNVQALACLDGRGVMVGILSQDHVAGAMALYGHDAVDCRVAQCMDAAFIACQAQDSADRLITLLDSPGHRLVAVLRDSDLLGLIHAEDLITV